jgi:hypothetical protein
MRKKTSDLSTYIPATRIVLRTLKKTGATMQYGDFMRVIGARGERERWTRRHFGLVTRILDLTHHCDRSLDFSCLINKYGGKPGAGFNKTSRIVKN